MRTVRKALRDLLVTNVIGTVLIAGIGFVTALIGIPDLGVEPAVLLKIGAVLTAALAVYRAFREHFGPLLRIDPK